MLIKRHGWRRKGILSADKETQAQLLLWTQKIKVYMENNSTQQMLNDRNLGADTKW